MTETVSLQPHVQRMIVEEAELRTKFNALARFFLTKRFTDMPETRAKPFGIQFLSMAMYLIALQARLHQEGVSISDRDRTVSYLSEDELMALNNVRQEQAGIPNAAHATADALKELQADLAEELGVPPEAVRLYAPN